MSEPAEHVISIKTATVLKVIGVILALGFLWIIRDILALLVVALFLAALMHPAARWGERHRIPRGATVLFIYLVLFALTILSFSLVIPTLLQQLGSLSRTVGSSALAISNGVHSLREFSDKYGLANNITAGLTSIQDGLSEAATGFLGAITNIFGGLVGFVVVLAMAFYMVVQDKDAVRVFRNIVPEPYQEKSANVLIQLEEKIGKWLGGQLILSLIVGVLYYIGLLVLGIDNPLALALFGAFIEFIPYLGPILGGIPIILVALSSSPIKALFALGLMVIVQQLESQIIVPKVMQKTLGLNPLVSIVAVLVGAKLFGIVGALLAIPVATALSVVLTEMYRHTQDTQSS